MLCQLDYLHKPPFNLPSGCYQFPGIPSFLREPVHHLILLRFGFIQNGSPALNYGL